MYLCLTQRHLHRDISTLAVSSEPLHAAPGMMGDTEWAYREGGPAGGEGRALALPTRAALGARQACPPLSLPSYSARVSDRTQKGWSLALLTEVGQ